MQSWIVPSVDWVNSTKHQLLWNIVRACWGGVVRPNFLMLVFPNTGTLSSGKLLSLINIGFGRQVIMASSSSFSSGASPIKKTRKKFRCGKNHLVSNNSICFVSNFIFLTFYLLRVLRARQNFFLSKYMNTPFWPEYTNPSVKRLRQGQLAYLRSVKFT